MTITWYDKTEADYEIKFLTCMLEDVQTFINHFSSGKPASFKKNPMIVLALIWPEVPREDLKILSISWVSVLEKKFSKDGEFADMIGGWRASETGQFLQFGHFVQEALLPPPGYMGTLHVEPARKYALENHVS
jgi:hypothetical protein